MLTNVSMVTETDHYYKVWFTDFLSILSLRYMNKQLWYDILQIPYVYAWTTKFVLKK